MNVALASWPKAIFRLMKFISNSPIVYIAANTYPQTPSPTVVTIAQNLVFALNRWNTNYQRERRKSRAAKSLDRFAEATTQPTSALGSSMSATAEKSGDAPTHADLSLPLTVDPLLAVGNPSQPPPRRHLGDALDQKLECSWANFVTTVDSRTIIACGYPDYSFRVIDTETGERAPTIARPCVRSFQRPFDKRFMVMVT